MTTTAHDLRRGSLFVIAAATMWGTWRLWLPGPSLDTAAQGATILTVAGLLGTVLALREGVPKVPRVAWVLMAAFTVSEAANFLLYFAALSSGDSATGSVTHYLAPVFVAVAAPLFGDRLGRRVLVATPVAFLATLVLVGVGGSEASSKAALLGGASAVFYAANILISKRLSRHFSSWAIVGFHDLAAAPIVWAFSSTPPWSASPKELGLAVTGALLGSGFFAWIYFRGVALIPAARAAVLSYAEPVGAAFVASMVLGEPLGGVKIAAIAVIVAAGAFVAAEE